MFMSAHCSFSGPCDPSLLLSRLWQAPLKRTFGFLGPFGAGPVSVSGGGSLSLSSSQCGCPTSPSPSAPGSLVVYALSSAPCSVTAVVQAQMMCPLGCKNGGVCDLRRGSCICPGGFSGLDCDWWAAPASTDSLDLAPKPFSSAWNKKEVVNNVAKSDIPLPTGYMPYHVWFLASAKSNFSLSITVTAGALGAEQLVSLDRLALIATFDSPLNLSTCLRLSALPTNISSGYGRLFNMTVDMAELRAANANNGLRVLLPFGPRLNNTFVLDAWSDRKEGIIHAALMAPAGLVIGDTTTRMITTADFRAALTMENSLAKPLSWGMFAFSFLAGVYGIKMIIFLVNHRRRIPPTVFSADAKFVAGATRNRIRIWEAATGRCVCLFAKMTRVKSSWSTVKEWFSKNTASIGVSALAVSHNSRKLAAGYRNGIIKVHLTSKQSGAMAFDATLQTNTKDDDVRELGFGGTRETSVLVSAFEGAHEYHVWDVRDDSLMKKVVVVKPAQTIHCPDEIKDGLTGGMVMSPSARPTLCIAWDQLSKKKTVCARIDVWAFTRSLAVEPFVFQRSLELGASMGKMVTNLCWLDLADPGPLLLVSTATSISAWNVETGKPVWENIESGAILGGKIVATFASRSGKHAASIHRDDSITLWSNLHTGTPAVAYYLGFPSVASSLAISEDERGVAVHCIGRDGVISTIPSSDFVPLVSSRLADLAARPAAQICSNCLGVRGPFRYPVIVPLERCIGANEADKLAIDEQADFFTHCKKVFKGHLTNLRFDSNSDDDEGKGDGGNDNSGVASAAKQAALEKITKFAAKAAAKNQGSSASHDGGTSMASGSEEGDGEKDDDVDQDGSSGKSLMEEVSGYGAGHTHASVSHHDEEEDDKPATEEDDDEDHEDKGSGDESSYGIVKRISGLGRSVGKKLKAWGETPSKPWMYGITVAFHVAEFFLRLVKVAFNLNFLHASLTVAFPKISLRPPAKVAAILSAIKGWLPNLSWSLSWSFSLTDWFSLKAIHFPHDCRIPMTELVLVMFAAFVAMFTILVAKEGYIVVKFSSDGFITKRVRRFGVGVQSIALKARDAIAVILLYMLQMLLSTMTMAVNERSKQIKKGMSCSSWDASSSVIMVISVLLFIYLIEFSFLISGGIPDRPVKLLRLRDTIACRLLKPVYVVVYTFIAVLAFFLAPPLRLLRLTFGIWTHSVVAHYNLRDLVFKNSQGKADNKTVPIIKALAQSCSLIWCLTPNTAFLVKVAEALNEAPIYVSGVTVRARSWQRALPWFVSVWTFTSCVLFLFYPSKGLLWSIFFSILPGVASSLVKDILKIKIDDNTVKANKKKQHDKP
jgi:WD40 repeat protein